MDERSERKPTMVEELLTRTRQFLAGVIADYTKRHVDELLRWILARAARTALSTALFIMAAAFMLLGGAKGLIVSGLAPHLAYMAIGAASLLAGLVTLKCCAPPAGRE